MFKREIDRSNTDKIVFFCELVDTAVNKSASQVILNKRGDTGDTPTIPESSAALEMLLRQTVEVVEGPTGLDKQRKFDIKLKCAKKRSEFKDDYSVTYSIWKKYLTFYTNILRMAY
jgi:hypothetical protein